MAQQKLSYTRLMSRKNFYRDKSLDLEQKVLFADEQMTALEEKLKQIEGLYEEKSKEYDELEASFADLESRYEQLKTAYGQSDEDPEPVAQSEESDAEPGHTQQYEERIAQFEKLLSEVQEELNEKDRQLEAYKSRVKSLEKRSSAQRTQVQPFQNTAETVRVGQKVLAYFDYSLVLYEQNEAIIRGNFHIENVGEQPLRNPYLCFRFYPLDASTLKGKIISIEQAEQKGDQPSSRPQWVYMDDQWAEEAKERGEIWVRPFEDVGLNPNETVTLPDFQIPVKKHVDENVMIEGFVFFQNEQYKAKASNQILITF